MQPRIYKQKMIKHKWGILSKLGKLEKKVKRNYVMHTTDHS